MRLFPLPDINPQTGGFIKPSYLSRFEKVLAFIDANLGENLSLDKLSDIACFSKYHFHRQFSELFGLSLFKYIQLQRLKRASYQLAFHKETLVIDIALEAGFENPESFSRAFKKTFEQTPNEFRKSPLWKRWQAKFQIINQKRIFKMHNKLNIDRAINMLDFPQTKLAVIEHCGDPSGILNSVNRLIAWRKENQLPPGKSKTYNIVYDDPEEVDPEKFRFDIGVATDKTILENDYGVIQKIIPTGRCAVLRHFGSDESLKNSFEYLYGQWLPQSNQEVRDFPCFMERVNLYPEVKEFEMITDIYLPLK